MKKIDKEEIIRIIKYLFSAGSSFFLDLLLFTLFKYVLSKILHIEDTIIIFIATALARVLSSFYNYIINSRFVFKNKDKKTIIGYYLLVIIQMIISATVVSIIDKLLNVNTTIIKFFIDIIIFIVNYIVQKEVIFKKKGEKHEEHI